MTGLTNVGMQTTLLATQANGGSLFTAAKDIFTTIYNGVNGIFNIICVVMLLICIIGTLVSKNQRAVDEFKAWRNRIVWGFVIFNCLGLFIGYGEELFSGYKQVDGLG